MGIATHTISSIVPLPRSRLPIPKEIYRVSPRDDPAAREAERLAALAVWLLKHNGFVVSFEFVVANSPKDGDGKDIAAIVLACHKHWFALQVGISNRALKRHRKPHRFQKELVFGEVDKPEPIVPFRLNPRSETEVTAYKRLFEAIVSHLQACHGSS